MTDVCTMMERNNRRGVAEDRAEDVKSSRGYSVESLSPEDAFDMYGGDGYENGVPCRMRY